MSEIIIGMKNGLMREGPFSISTVCCCSNVVMPPIPEPMIAPKRSASNADPSIPAIASLAAAKANWTERSERRASFLSMYRSGSKFLTSPPICESYALTSKAVMRARPEAPDEIFAQLSPTV